ncbi:arrestin domain-containing protein 3-like [Plakobranchus ocellatus]|uniref:Arrestin domain-containing protein 3-like n=1 Tax=Plakobranchus ocellatus TaxID=259542 RepID=A0AAV3XUT6_9GAST|nr:arrestin domain-containing protein 3-like [Plakobranchus ocellatus]
MKTLNLVQILELRSGIQHLVLLSVQSAQSDTPASVATSIARCTAKRRVGCEVFLFSHHHRNINFYRLVSAILTSCVDEKMCVSSRLRPGSARGTAVLRTAGSGSTMHVA